MNKPFIFKEFTINQDKTAMKVGTDGVLLGAWCLVDKHTDTILDVGAGTGLLSLMMAQKTDANTIDAIEIDANAYEQSVENFEQSDWGDRLYCYHTSFNEFVQEISEEEETYDLIISNPPFYTDSFETKNNARNKARFTSSLSFKELLKGVPKILSKKGTFNTIIPFKEEENFVQLAKNNGLFLNRICRVQGTLNSEIKRSLLSFSFINKQPFAEQLTIEKERHNYTNDYINLTKDFYLKM